MYKIYKYNNNNNSDWPRCRWSVTQQRDVTPVTGYTSPLQPGYSRDTVTLDRSVSEFKNMWWWTDAQ